MAYFLLRFILLLAFFHLAGYPTKTLQMIKWSPLNPSLSCKCKCLTIHKVDVKDPIIFMCPSSLDGHSRPSSEMNENIFHRKWDKDLKDLPIFLDNGSFCDPSNINAVKLGTCKDGKEGQSHAVTFKSSPNNGKSYKEGDIVVFFNNGNDGREATLDSKVPRCSMVFVVNITWLEKSLHDFSYGKCLMPDGNTCTDVNKRCRVDHCKLPPTTATGTAPTTPGVPKTQGKTTTSAPAPTQTIEILPTTRPCVPGHKSSDRCPVIMI